MIIVKVGINKFIPDANEKQKNEITAYIGDLTGKVKLILAEMSGNWLQRSWRPILMLSIVAIIVNNYLLYPYLSLFWSEAPTLVLPNDLYDLMKIGVGGYIVGRSTEKAVKTWKNS